MIKVVTMNDQILAPFISYWVYNHDAWRIIRQILGDFKEEKGTMQLFLPLFSNSFRIFSLLILSNRGIKKEVKKGRKSAKIFWIIFLSNLLYMFCVYFIWNLLQSNKAQDLTNITKKSLFKKISGINISPIDGQNHTERG